MKDKFENDRSEEMDKEDLEDELEWIDDEYKNLKELYNDSLTMLDSSEKSIKLLNELHDLDHHRRDLNEKINDSQILNDIEKTKDHSEYWAKKYKSDFDNINKKIQEEKEAPPKNEMEEMLKPSTILQKQKLKTRVELASTGLTPDDLTAMSLENDRIFESISDSDKHYEELEKLLDQVSYEEAEVLLEQGKKEGKYTNDEYHTLMAMIRKRFKK